jgi:hypothetical protein
MTETNLQGESPAEGASPLPEESGDAAPPAASDEATRTPAADASDEPSDDGDKPKGRGGFQSRIDKLTWEKNQAAREAEYWRQLAMTSAKPAESESPAVPKEPTRDQFEDDAGYLRAIRDFDREAARREARAEAEQVLLDREKAASERARDAAHREREAKFIASHPDYESRVLDDLTLPITQDMAEFIRESEDGPDLAYHLAEHREIAERIARLPAVQAARELVRLEARLATERAVSAKPPAPKPQVSQAPPPPPQIEATEAAPRVRTTDSSGDALSDSEWVAMERKRLARKR